MIDLHCHLLPGIDDGPRSMSDAVTMARAAVAAGTTAMVCTPHMHPRFPTRPATVLAGVAALADARIAHLAAGDRLDDAPDGRVEALAGADPTRDVVACALLLDHLRRLDRDGRIAGEVGWAMRRWAWAELGRALRRLAAEAPDVHRGAAEAAERQLRRGC